MFIDFEAPHTALDETGFAVRPRSIPSEALEPVRVWAADVVADAAPGWSEHTVSSGEAGAVPAALARLATEVSDTVAESFSRRFVQHGWTLIAKAPRRGTATRWHQDEAYLGGRLPFDLVTAWLPLADVDEQSACLRYVPLTRGYGLLPHTMDPDTASDPIPTLLAEPPAELLRAAVSCPMAAGDVSLHVPATLHASHPNRAAEPRYAFILDLVARRPR